MAQKARGRRDKVRQPSEKTFQEEQQRVATDEGMPTEEEAKKRLYRPAQQLPSGRKTKPRRTP